MTFSLLLRDSDTGEFGAVISSSSPAVSARCLNLKDGVGAASSQNVTDPRLGPALIEAMERGKQAQLAVDSVVAAGDRGSMSFRQLLAIDRDGETAAYSGKEALGTFGSRLERNAVAGGNMLSSLKVLDALVEAALDSAGCIEEKLYAGLQAAINAGGEAGPVHSAGLAVVSDVGWRVTDLRVDWHDDDPIGQLGNLVKIWLPQKADYVNRGLDPASSPSYGVPGDDR